MDGDGDTFVTTVYTVVDELYQAEIAPYQRRLGRPVQVSDSEVLTLLVLVQWRRCSERALLRHAQAAWSALFPRLLSQSAFNRRARNLAGVLAWLVPRLAARLGASTASYEAIDGVPVPLARRCRGDQHRLFGVEAAVGRGGSDRDWYYGCELLLSVAAGGAITGFVVGPANTDDHWLAEALLCWREDATAQPWTPADLPPSHQAGGGRRGPSGPLWPRNGAGTAGSSLYICDLAFRGADWADHWALDYGALVLTKALYKGAAQRPARRRLASLRQVVETVNGQLEQCFGLAFPGARSLWGLRTRIAAKLFACNLALLLNDTLGRPRFAMATLAA